MIAIKNLFQLFYPKLCAVCEHQLIENEQTLCTVCRHDLPLTNITDYKNNALIDSFYGKVFVEKAFSLLFYRKESKTKTLIRELKYKSNENIGLFFGNWLGEMLKNNQEFKTVDCILPVPLHKKKLKQRGYNQLTKFGERLSYHLNIPYVANKLIRISSTKTQTLQSRFERFSNLETKFVVTNHSFFNNKHVLLIDDVITTGATLEACIREIQKSENAKVSILSMAYTE